MQMLYDVFHWCEQTCPSKKPDMVQAKLYAILIDEEYQEFKDSTNDENKLKEAMDLIWVLLGYCIARGWGVVGAWGAVYKSNMAKLQRDHETQKLKTREDGKILKPADWQAPDLTPYLHGECVSQHSNKEHEL